MSPSAPDPPLSTQPGTARPRATTALLWGGCGVALAGAVLAIRHANADIPFRDDYAGYSATVAVSCALYCLLGALILRRHPRHPIAVLFLFFGLSSAFAQLCRQYALLGADGGALLPGSSWAWWIASFAWYPAYALPGTVMLVLFPTGRPHSRRWWPLAGAAAALVAADTLWFAFTPFDTDLPPELAALNHPLGRHGQPRRFEDVFTALPQLYLVVTLLCLAALVARLRTSTGVARRQVGWFAFGSALWVLAAGIDAVTHYSEDRPWAELIFIALPALGATIGIVRHDLFDIRRVVHRGAVLLAFTAAIAVAYAAIVLFAQRWVGRPREDVWSAAMAVALIAVAALPTARALDRVSRRLLYGERDDPRAVLARLGEELERTSDPAQTLLCAAEAIASSLRLPYVRIAADALAPAETGDPRADVETRALNDRGIHVGTLVLGRRAPGEPFDASERDLLDDLAGRLATAIHALALDADLRRSREDLVLAREEERRRIRSDLHDGLGPQLAGIGLQLDLGRELLDRDPARVRTMLDRARDELDAALVGIRHVVDGLRPPALDELGLAGAIRQQVASHDASVTNGLTVSVFAPDELGELPAAVEVAAFRIATEAVTNVSRHSGADRCEVYLEIGDSLAVTVRDNGSGIDAGAIPGVGLHSMRRRAEELGGTLDLDSDPARGTELTARLPIR